MDHEVQHHRDVQAPWAERRGAHRLKGQRPATGRGRHHGPKCRRKAFNMANLQDPPLPGGQRNQPIRLIKARRYGFFDKDMPAGRKGLFRQRVMKAGRCRNNHSLRRRDHGLRRQGGCADLGGDLRGPVGRGIMQANQADRAVGGGLQGMETAKMTNP